MILTTFAPSEHTIAELAAVTVEVKHGGWVCDIGAEQVSELELSRIAPIRISKAYPGRENYSGVYWSATTGRHHWFESLYEKTALSVLDRDPAVADIATQPFKLRWGRLGMTHFPDFLIRRSDGSRLIVDVRPRRRIKARDAELFAVTAAWAASLEMGYRLFADLSKVQGWNIRLLAGLPREPPEPRVSAARVAAPRRAHSHGISQEELDRYRSMVPVIFPENITVDHGKIFTSTAFTEACERLGISIIECNPYTPTGKPHTS